MPQSTKAFKTLPGETARPSELGLGKERLLHSPSRLSDFFHSDQTRDDHGGHNDRGDAGGSENSPEKRCALPAQIGVGQIRLDPGAVEYPGVDVIPFLQ